MTKSNAGTSLRFKDIPPTCVFDYFKARKVKAVEDLKSCPETPRSLTSPLTSDLDPHLKFDIKRNSLLQLGFVLLFWSYFRDNLS